MVALKLFRRKWVGKPLELTDWLWLSVTFSILLLIARVLVTEEITYLFLPWNLFLAWVPLLITRWLQNDIRLMEKKWAFLLLLGIWLLFIPNSFYIITDLFHLTHIDSAPKWFDLLLLFSFAWNGLLLGGFLSSLITLIWRPGESGLITRFISRKGAALCGFGVIWPMVAAS